MNTLDPFNGFLELDPGSWHKRLDDAKYLRAQAYDRAQRKAKLKAAIKLTIVLIVVG